jgi:hypothetical protein
LHLRLLDRELELKRFEATQARRFTNTLSEYSTVLYNEADLNTVAVLLQVLNHEENKDAKVRHVLAVVQASMSTSGVLPDDQVQDAQGKVCCRTSLSSSQHTDMSTQAVTKAPDGVQSSSKGSSGSVPKSIADPLALKDTTNKKKDPKPSSTGYDCKTASQPKIRTKTKAQMDAGKKLAQQRAKDINLFGEPIDDRVRSRRRGRLLTAKSAQRPTRRRARLWSPSPRRN